MSSKDDTGLEICRFFIHSSHDANVGAPYISNISIDWKEIHSSECTEPHEYLSASLYLK